MVHGGKNALHAPDGVRSGGGAAVPGQLHGAEALHGSAGLIGLQNVLAGHLMQPEPLAGQDVDQLLLAQAHQRVLHGGAGDVQLRSHPGLGVQHIGLELPRQHLVPDVVIRGFLKGPVFRHVGFPPFESLVETGQDPLPPGIFPRFKRHLAMGTLYRKGEGGSSRAFSIKRGPQIWSILPLTQYRYTGILVMVDDRHPRRPTYGI